MKTSTQVTQVRVGQRHLLTKQAARFAPKVIEKMFLEMEAYTEGRDLELDWSTLYLKVDVVKGDTYGEYMDGTLEFLMEMMADEKVRRDSDPRPSA